MAFSLRFGDLVLDGCRIFQGRSGYRVTRHRLGRRPGAIAPRVPPIDEKTIVLQGDLWKDSEAQIEQYFELLGRKLDNGRDRLYLRTNDRYLNAVGENFEWAFQAESVPLLHATYSLAFVADDPYWYHPSQSEQVEVVGAVNTHVFSVTNLGGSRTPPVFEIRRTDPANDQANVRLEQTTTGMFMEWQGTLPDGNSVIFDCVNQRVSAQGGDGMAAFDGSIMLNLESGINNFEYRGPGNVEIVIAYIQRWSQS